MILHNDKSQYFFESAKQFLSLYITKYKLCYIKFFIRTYQTLDFNLSISINIINLPQ